MMPAVETPLRLPTSAPKLSASHTRPQFSQIISSVREMSETP